ncbi:hypothetical protein A9179_11570 [Pseudomonas alcaligenes]|uniref:Uncharacterized protein n=1 Tax=Aquipseudomonas alcaligenes TaxID=43263 RepID=A0ABR7S027_AQUAC|nr:hypothetical protein [Pseudomonas alcaligenes]
MHVGYEALRLIHQCSIISSADTLHYCFGISDSAGREAYDTMGKRLAKAAELLARQCTIDPAITLCSVSIKILASKAYFQGPTSSQHLCQTHRSTSSREKSYSNFWLTKHCCFAIGKSHV